MLCSNMAYLSVIGSGGEPWGSSPYHKVNTIMCSLGQASWLLDRHCLFSNMRLNGDGREGVQVKVLGSLWGSGLG